MNSLNAFGDKEHLYNSIQKLKIKYELGTICDFEFAAGYICLYSQFYCHMWCNGHSPLTLPVQTRALSSSFLMLKDVDGLILPKRLEGASGMLLMDFMRQYSLKNIKLFVRQELMEWSLGKRGYQLVFSIPDPEVVLNQMISGKRAITALVQRDELDITINDDYPPFKSRDPLEFLIHDLQHMREFGGSEDFFKEQLGFFKLCRKFLNPTFLMQELGAVIDIQFKKDLEHCLSDMNACSLHLFKFLKAKIIDAENRAVCRGEVIDRQKQPILRIVLQDWNVNMDSLVWMAAMNCCKSKDPEGDIILRDFFLSNSES